MVVFSAWLAVASMKPSCQNIQYGMYRCSCVCNDTLCWSVSLFSLFCKFLSVLITSCLLQHYDIIVFNCKEKERLKEAVSNRAGRGQSPTVQQGPSHPVVEIRQILSEEFYRGWIHCDIFNTDKAEFRSDNLTRLCPRISTSSSIYTLDIIIPCDIRAWQATGLVLSPRIIIFNEFSRFYNFEP